MRKKVNEEYEVERYYIYKDDEYFDSIDYSDFEDALEVARENDCDEIEMHGWEDEEDYQNRGEATVQKVVWQKESVGRTGRQLKEGKVATAVFEHEVQVRLLYDENLSVEDTEMVVDYLKDYFKKNQRKDWPYFDIEVEPAGEGVIDVTFTGEGEYKLIPSTPAPLNDPGAWDPGEMEYPFEEEDFQDYVLAALKKAPFDLDFDYETEFIEYPSDDEINEKLNDNLDDTDGYADYLYDQWRESHFESVMNGVLAGKTLTEAMKVNEHEFWELQPEEVYDDPVERHRENMRKDFSQWRADAQVKINKVATAIRDLQKVMDDCDKFEIYYESIPGCPFKSFSNLSRDTDKWTKQFFELLDKTDLIG